MKKQILLLIIILGVTAGISSNSAHGQTLELLGGNTLNGAVNGVVLGGATMALQSSNDFAPVRAGLGAGTLFGIGTGVYDISQTESGQQFYISGTFNDGTNSSILILLDTFYGAAGGALIASSVSLIIKSPFDKAIQYGAGTGAWAGFGFGLVDAFSLAQGPNFSQQQADTNQNTMGGLFTYSNKTNSIELGMLNPELIQQKEISRGALRTTYEPTLNVIQVSVDL